MIKNGMKYAPKWYDQEHAYMTSNMHQNKMVVQTNVTEQITIYYY